MHNFLICQYVKRCKRKVKREGSTCHSKALFIIQNMRENNTLRKEETRAAWKIVSYGPGRGKDQTHIICGLKYGLQYCPAPSETQICQVIFFPHTSLPTFNFLIVCNEHTSISSPKDSLTTNRTPPYIHISLVQAKCLLHHPQTRYCVKIRRCYMTRLCRKDEVRPSINQVF